MTTSTGQIERSEFREWGRGGQLAGADRRGLSALFWTRVNLCLYGASNLLWAPTSTRYRIVCSSAMPVSSAASRRCRMSGLTPASTIRRWTRERGTSSAYADLCGHIGLEQPGGGGAQHSASKTSSSTATTA
jgi:hypothetical protein